MSETNPSAQGRAPGRRLERATAICFFATGMTALILETVWARYLQVFTGSTTLACTLVLASFMGGLALGSHFLGRVADRVTYRLRLYALLELTVGLYALCFPWIIDGAVVPRRVMTVAVAGDHRVSDGRVAARFLSRLAEIFKEPEQL